MFPSAVLTLTYHILGKTPEALTGIPLLTNFLFFFLSLFIYYFRESGRERTCAHAPPQEGEGETERETQNPKQAPGSELSLRSPMQGLNPGTVRSRPEPKSDT